MDIGAGKSTLLDVLADRKTTGKVSGIISFNGKERNIGVQLSSAYVMQDDVHIGLLSVRECLRYAGRLRLDESWTLEAKEDRVNLLLNMLGLMEVADTCVGDDLTRGISGGQRKRLSIAVEIIHLPNLIYLDGMNFISCILCLILILQL